MQSTQSFQLQTTRRHALALLLAAAATAHAPSASAQTAGQAAGAFPTRPIRLVVTFPPGQAADLAARLVAPRMAAALNQPVLIDNRPGASGFIGAEAVAKSAPDGHTLLVVTTGLIAGNASLFKKLPYRPLVDFAPVGTIAAVPQLLVATQSFAPSSLQDFVAYAKARPGQVPFGSSGLGQTSHLSMELLQKGAGLSLTHVPYKGSAPALSDLIGGQIPVMFDTSIATLPHIRSGKLKALATGSAKRVSALPDLPTVAESGLRGFDTTAWIGIVGPAATPAAVLDRLARELQAAVESPEVKARLIDMATEPLMMGRAEFGTFMAEETTKWSKAVRDAGIQPE